MNRDTRYILESAQNCCDGTSHAPFAWITEGFVGMMLRDIEDPAPELPAGPPYACPQDALDMLPGDIFAVVRESHPTVMMSFLQAFWTRFPQKAHDIKATATAVAPVYGSILPTPPIEIYGTSSCDVAKVGQPLSLHVDTNGSPWSLKMQWHRNGIPLLESATRTGCFTDTLNISAAALTDAGTYTLKISLCDGTQVQWSPAMPVYVFGGTGGGHHLMGWGRNTFGALGRGTTQPDTDANPAEVANLDNVVDVSAGYWNSLALLADGTVRSWGAAYLGDGTANQSATPVTVNGLSNIVAISAGGYETSMALDADGKVWTWGGNYYGQIGDPMSPGRLEPAQVPGLSCVVAISMGGYSAAAVTADGRLWTWGYNGYGELGLGVTGSWYTSPQLVPGLTDVVEVECGWSHIIARRSDGTVWCCGNNASGQLGDGTFNNRNTFGQVPGLTDVISVKAGALHSLALQSDRTPWTWGYDGFGQLGRTTLPGNSAVPVRPANPQRARSLDGGYYNSLFVDMDGVIWTCGYWGYGALGRPGLSFAPEPVAFNVGAAVKASAGIDVMFTTAPVARIISQPVDQIVAGCGTSKLHVAAIGEPLLEYQWQRFNGSNWDVLYDGGRYSGTTSDTLTINSTNVIDSGTYRVTVTNPTNDVFSNEVTLQAPPVLDTFDSGPNPRWLGERGSWTIAGGGYSAGAPNLNPATYSSFMLPMTDFSVEFDVVRATYVGFTGNTGVWLRSALTGFQPSGVLLSLGDLPPYNTGDVFWTRWNGNGYSAPEGVVQGLYNEGDTVHMRVDVRGNTYTAYINDATTPTTTLVTPDYPAGKIALFDNASTDTLFDNLFIQSLPSCEPGSGMIPPRVVTRPQSQSVANGAQVYLNITVEGDGPLTFQWNRNGVCIPGADFTGYLFTASVATAGRYDCAVTSPCGSVSSFPAIVTLSGALPAGDIDGDGDLDMNDVNQFAAVLLGQDVVPEHMLRADINQDGFLDARDAQPFVEAFLN
ncbi:MAG: hypothetical protein IPK83_11805 [Planctomycetes bacterium]|nr:hypothetical protein [Planctomycetota bacterium]